MFVDVVMMVWFVGVNVLVNCLIGCEKVFDGVCYWYWIVYMQMVVFW